MRYFSIGAHYQGPWWAPPWTMSAPVVQNVEGDHDGLVSLESAKYGESFDVWPGDHFSLVNWPTRLPFQDQSFRYGQIVQKLHELNY